VQESCGCSARERAAPAAACCAHGLHKRRSRRSSQSRVSACCSLRSAPAEEVAVAETGAAADGAIRPEAVERALDAFGGVRRPSLGAGLDAELAAFGGEAAPEGLAPESAEATDPGGKLGGARAPADAAGASAVAALRAGVARLASTSSVVAGEGAQRFWKWLQARAHGAAALERLCAGGALRAAVRARSTGIAQAHWLAFSPCRSVPTETSRRTPKGSAPAAMSASMQVLA